MTPPPLSVDPMVDPEPLLFKSIGKGSNQLNYSKVYSSLYKFEGHIVLYVCLAHTKCIEHHNKYMVVIKVGKPTECSKLGNCGKHNSQIALLHYLNRVHFNALMSPLELENYHQMWNVIGIDLAFYKYVFKVDADTVRDSVIA
jgi:chitin synthase